MNYQKLMENNPTILDFLINNKGQEIVLVEHPLKGDEFPVIAVCHKLKLAASTDFFETDDMMASHKEYEPWFTDKNKLELGYY